MEVPDKKSLSEKELEDLVIVPALHRSGWQPSNYQLIAVNRTLEAVLRGQRRLLLVMATGTGKTYMASQIVYRLREAKLARRFLFLVDRNTLADQTLRNDFKMFSKVAKFENAG